MSAPRNMTVARIIVAVSEDTGVPVPAFRSEVRTHDIAQARHAAMFVARRRLATWSWKRLAREFDRDRSTVAGAIEKTARRLPHDPDLRDLVARVEASLERQEGHV
ncbi:helix-turn-helix domain-containing protein [Humitalea sp. 24SJ18S-53]|uniref:helix-turn-helix domain-containing protein n=1 Tax=Humitalea sp. 24SJ18S-53 TaxID=3422307 RepID=UPI003D66D36E